MEDEIIKHVCKAESHIINSCYSNDETGDHLGCRTFGEIAYPAVNYIFVTIFIHCMTI